MLRRRGFNERTYSLYGLRTVCPFFSDFLALQPRTSAAACLDETQQNEAQRVLRPPKLLKLTGELARKLQHFYQLR